MVMLVGFDLGGVNALIIDDDQVHLGGIFHVDVCQQFWTGDGPSLFEVGQGEFFGVVANFDGELDRRDLGFVEIIEVDDDHVFVVVVSPLGMTARRLKMQ